MTAGDTRTTQSTCSGAWRTSSTTAAPPIECPIRTRKGAFLPRRCGGASCTGFQSPIQLWGRRGACVGHPCQLIIITILIGCAGPWARVATANDAERRGRGALTRRGASWRLHGAQPCGRKHTCLCGSESFPTKAVSSLCRAALRSEPLALFGGATIRMQVCQIRSRCRDLPYPLWIPSTSSDRQEASRSEFRDMQDQLSAHCDLPPRA